MTSTTKTTGAERRAAARAVQQREALLKLLKERARVITRHNMFVLSWENTDLTFKVSREIISMLTVDNIIDVVNDFGETKFNWGYELVHATNGYLAIRNIEDIVLDADVTVVEGEVVTFINVRHSMTRLPQAELTTNCAFERIAVSVGDGFASDNILVDGALLAIINDSWEEDNSCATEREVLIEVFNPFGGEDGLGVWELLPGWELVGDDWRHESGAKYWIMHEA